MSQFGISLKKLPKENIAILSTKNNKAIEDLSQHFDLNFPEEKIYASDTGANKLENFKKIKLRFGEREYIFLEDSLDNLVALTDSATPCLALWGNVNQEQIKKAKELKIRTLSLNSIEDFIKNDTKKLNMI